jgi:hypothetical protein
VSRWVVPARGLGRFDDLIFCPLDLPEPPAIDVPKFISWMASDPTGSGRVPKERFERLTGRPYPWLMRVASGEMDSLREAFPEVYEYCARYPLKNLRNLVFLAQDGHQAVFPHTDSDGLVGLRLYLANANVEGLHFYQGRERYDYFSGYRTDEDGQPISVDFRPDFHMDSPIYAQFPEKAGPFMLNSARAVHAVDANTCKLGDRIAVLVQGDVDMNRYERLIESSLSKFGDCAIWYK